MQPFYSYRTASDWIATTGGLSEEAARLRLDVCDRAPRHTDRAPILRFQPFQGNSIMCTDGRLESRESSDMRAIREAVGAVAAGKPSMPLSRRGQGGGESRRLAREPARLPTPAMSHSIGIRSNGS
jgi:hypothetical protein